MYDVTLRNTNVTIKPSGFEDTARLNAYVYRRLTEYQFQGKKEYIPELQRVGFPIKAIYADRYKTNTVVSRLAYDSLKKELSNMYGCVFREEELSSYIPADIDQTMQKGIKPRKYQVPAIKFVQTDSPYNARMFALQPGQGKTLSTLFTLDNLGVPAVGLMRPSFIGVWKKSIDDFTTADKSDYLIIKGKKQLQDWVDSLEDDDYEPIRYVLISNKTYDRWIKRMVVLLTDGHRLPDVNPWNVMQWAQAGVTFVDETHLDFHFNYMLLLRTNAPKIIGLSGTFVSEDQFLIARQADMYPPVTHQYDSLTVKQYIHVINYIYNTPAGIRPTISHRGNKMYNHTAYEKWISKSPSRLFGYFSMITEVLDHDYISHRISGSKALVFFASVDMVKGFTAHIRANRPELETIVFVAGNEYEELLTPDLITSTLLKAGTGVDIPKLMLVINTVSVRSIQSNRQSIGRLRDLEEELGIEMRYVQIYNKMIMQHLTYASARKRQWMYIQKSTHSFERISPI